VCYGLDVTRLTLPLNLVDAVPLTIRAQLAVVLLLVIVVITTLLGVVSYSRSRRAIDDYAVRLLASAADNRAEMLVHHLQRERELALDLLKAIDLACGPSGRINGICARESIYAFLRKEGALAGRIRLGPRNSIYVGRSKALPPAEQDEQRPQPAFDFHGSSPATHLVRVSDPDTGLTLTLAYDNDELQSLVSNSGLGPAGELAFYDARGALISAGKQIGSSAVTAGIELTAACAKGPGTMLAPDLDGRRYLFAYEPVPQIGGCVVAGLDRATALASAASLRRTFIWMAILFSALGFGVAYGVSWFLTKPIDRLERRVRALEAGDFDTPVPSSGPSEIREFARAFGRMAVSLKQSRLRLVEKERAAATADLASALAHQINNPLAALTYALALLKAKFGKDPASESYLNVADEETGRITRIVKSILALYSEGATLQPILLSALLDKVIARRRRALDEKSLDVVKKVEFDQTLPVYARELEQAIGNVLDNAITFLPPGSKISAHIYASREWKAPHRPGIRIVIADNGPGIPADQRAAIFEPFVSTRPEKGSGLGLWITQAVAHKHGGYVRVHSSFIPGRTGTAFSIFIPTPEAQLAMRNAS
jgi:signal transduction histidine kinase